MFEKKEDAPKNEKLNDFIGSIDKELHSNFNLEEQNKFLIEIKSRIVNDRKDRIEDLCKNVDELKESLKGINSENEKNIVEPSIDWNKK